MEKVKVWFLFRWVANKAKLAGHTIRKSPSEISWEIVLSDGRWFRAPRNPLKGRESFAIEIKAKKEEILKFMERLEEEEFVTTNPGEFGNPLKGAFVFYQLEWKGQSPLIEDQGTLQLKIKGKKLVFIPRPEVKGSFRIYHGTPPGSERFEKEDTHVAGQLLGHKAAPLFTFVHGQQAMLSSEAREYRPGTDPKVHWVKIGDTWDLIDVPIALPGLWNGVKVDKALLLRLIENFEKLKATVFVPLKVGHTQTFVEVARYERTGQPALGYVKALRWDEEDQKLRATFTKVPSLLVDLIKKGAFTGISIEIDPDFSGYGDTLIAVSILGAELPAMTSLPRLISIYSSERKTYTVSFTGGENKVEKDALAKLLAQQPQALLLFQEGGLGKEELDKLVEFLRGKGYPRVLAEELIDLMPEPSEEKLKLLPDYDPTLWKPRLKTLRRRAELPEKCEAVIAELEEFLEMYKEDERLDEETRREVEEILALARKNLPHLEVSPEEAKAEAKVAPTPAEEAKGAVVETPPEAPKKLEKYPEEGPHVIVEELQKLRSREQEIEVFRAELAKKAQEAIQNKLLYYQSIGVPAEVLADLRDALVQLDPALTAEPDRTRLQQIILKLVTARPTSQTFQRLVPAEEAEDEGLAQLILKAARSQKFKKRE